jgi:hypothetical protein
MGMDVRLYAEVTPTVEELAAAEVLFNSLSAAGDREGPSLEFHKAVEGNPIDLNQTNDRVELNTLYRWWGRGHGKGHWPQICTAIRAMQQCFPDAEVFYGSDLSYNGELVTEEYIGDSWAAWFRQEEDRVANN